MKNRIYENGVYRDMTPEEIRAMDETLSRLHPAQPSPEREIEELKAQLSSMEAAYVRGVNEA